MISCNARTLDALANRYGTLADWTPSSGNPVVAAGFRLRLSDEILRHLDDHDAALLFHRMRGLNQADVGRMVGRSQPSVSERLQSAIRRARYIDDVLTNRSDIGRAFADLRGVDPAHARAAADYLLGATSIQLAERFQWPQSTTWDRIRAVEKRAIAAAEGGNRRARTLARLFRSRRDFWRV